MTCTFAAQFNRNNKTLLAIWMSDLLCFDYMSMVLVYLGETFCMFLVFSIPKDLNAVPIFSYCLLFSFGALSLLSGSLIFCLPSFVNLIEFKQRVFLSLVCLLCFTYSLALKVMNSKFDAAVSACLYLRDCSYIVMIKHI